MDPVKKEGRVEQSSGGSRGRPRFVPNIPTNNAPPIVPVKTENIERQGLVETTHRREGEYRSHRGRRGRGSQRGRRSAPRPKKRTEKNEQSKPEPPKEVKVYDDRFDETANAGTYPVSVPLLPPQDAPEAPNLGAFFEKIDMDTMMFMQLPSIFPVTSEHEENPIPMGELPSGYLGKMIVYRSGKVKMKVGNILFDVDLGTKSTCHQEVAYISPEKRKLVVLGPLKQRIVVTPNVESLFSDEFDDEDENEKEEALDTMEL